MVVTGQIDDEGDIAVDAITFRLHFQLLFHRITRLSTRLGHHRQLHLANLRGYDGKIDCLAGATTRHRYIANVVALDVLSEAGSFKDCGSFT